MLFSSKNTVDLPLLLVHQAIVILQHAYCYSYPCHCLCCLRSSCCGTPYTFYFNIFGRAPSAASKMPENILLKRPPVPRASSAQDGLVELNSDAAIRGKNPPISIPAEGIILRLLCNFLFLHLVYVVQTFLCY